MAVIRAIPKSLLIHRVSYVKMADADRWGSTEAEDKKELCNVRMEPSSKIVRDKNNAEIQIAAVLFYDCKNSKPKGVVFAHDDVIIFNGCRHSIQFVEPLYDGRRLHHYELGLIKHA